MFVKLKFEKFYIMMGVMPIICKKLSIYYLKIWHNAYNIANDYIIMQKRLSLLEMALFMLGYTRIHKMCLKGCKSIVWITK